MDSLVLQTTSEEDFFATLKIGDKIVNSVSGNSYVVNWADGKRITAIRTISVSNPSEWQIVR